MVQSSRSAPSAHQSATLDALGGLIGRVLIIVALMMGLAFTIYPFLFMLSTSLQTNAEIFSAPPKLIPPPGSSRTGRTCSPKPDSLGGFLIAQ